MTRITNSSLEQKLGFVSHHLLTSAKDGVIKALTSRIDSIITAHESIPLREIERSEVLGRAVKAAFDEFAPQIWADSSDVRDQYLVNAQLNTLGGFYPRDLYYTIDEDREELQQLFHTWLALKCKRRRANINAGVVKPKGNPTAWTPLRQASRRSTSIPFSVPEPSSETEYEDTEMSEIDHASPEQSRTTYRSRRRQVSPQLPTRAPSLRAKAPKRKLDEDDAFLGTFAGTTANRAKAKKPRWSLVLRLKIPRLGQKLDELASRTDEEKERACLAAQNYMSETDEEDSEPEEDTPQPEEDVLQPEEVTFKAISQPPASIVTDAPPIAMMQPDVNERPPAEQEHMPHEPHQRLETAEPHQKLETTEQEHQPRQTQKLEVKTLLNPEPELDQRTAAPDYQERQARERLELFHSYRALPEELQIFENPTPTTSIEPNAATEAAAPTFEPVTAKSNEAVSSGTLNESPEASSQGPPADAPIHLQPQVHSRPPTHSQPPELHFQNSKRQPSQKQSTNGSLQGTIATPPPSTPGVTSPREQYHPQFRDGRWDYRRENTQSAFTTNTAQPQASAGKDYTAFETNDTQGGVDDSSMLPDDEFDNVSIIIDWALEDVSGDYMTMENFPTVEYFFLRIEEYMPDSLVVQGKRIKEVRVKSLKEIVGPKPDCRIIRDNRLGWASLRQLLKKLKKQSESDEPELKIIVKFE